jgi:hypothetical protein
MLVAKSIRTGCPPFTGKPASAYSQSALEQKGRNSRSRIDDEHRGQRTPNFDRFNPADPYERLTMDSKRQPSWHTYYARFRIRNCLSELNALNSILLRTRPPSNHAPAASSGRTGAGVCFKPLSGDPEISGIKIGPAAHFADRLVRVSNSKIASFCSRSSRNLAISNPLPRPNRVSLNALVRLQTNPATVETPLTPLPSRGRPR